MDVKLIVIIFLIKYTHREKKPSNKTPALKKRYV